MPEIAEPEIGLPSFPDAFDIRSIAPDGMLRGLVARMTHYRELRPGHYRQAEAAALVYPLIISFGEPFLSRIDTNLRVGGETTSLS